MPSGEPNWYQNLVELTPFNPELEINPLRGQITVECPVLVKVTGPYVIDVNRIVETENVKVFIRVWNNITGLFFSRHYDVPLKEFDPEKMIVTGVAKQETFWAEGGRWLKLTMTEGNTITLRLSTVSAQYVTVINDGTRWWKVDDPSVAKINDPTANKYTLEPTRWQAFKGILPKLLSLSFDAFLVFAYVSIFLIEVITGVLAVIHHK